MSSDILYHVAGFFEGSFKTFQDMDLSVGDSFPEGDKHLIRIYRGIITKTQYVSHEIFKNAEYDLNVKKINNVQINASNDWPEKHDRIFSLKEIKLKKIEITGLQSIHGHTYGNIKGEIIASVTNEKYIEPDFIEKERPSNDPIPDLIHQHIRPKRGGDINLSKGKHKGQTNNTSKGGGRIWDFTLANRFWQWVLAILSLLALLFLILCFTHFGRQMICRIQKWYYLRQLEQITAQRKELEEIIQRTKPKPSRCGSTEEFNGTSEPKDYTYTLGTTSGNVIIQYDMFGIPDRLEVIYNGKRVAATNDQIMTKLYKKWENTGFAQNAGQLIVPYVYKVNEIHELTIRVIPNPDSKTTKWKFNVICP